MTEKSIIHFDIECTGTNIATDRIIQLSLIRTNLYFEIKEKKKLLLSNCGVPIHPKAFEAHGISESDLIGKFTFAQYAPQILKFLDSADYLHGYNIKSFDIPLMYEEFSRSGLEWNPKPAIDSCVIFKKKEARTLSAAHLFYCGEPFENAHDAESDVIASINVLKYQISHYGFGFDADIFETVINESCYEDEHLRLDFAGKIILNSNLVPIWSFGKCKDKSVLNDLEYCDWVLKSDFPSQTKNVLRKILKSKSTTSK